MSTRFKARLDRLEQATQPRAGFFVMRGPHAGARGPDRDLRGRGRRYGARHPRHPPAGDPWDETETVS